MIKTATGINIIIQLPDSMAQSEGDSENNWDPETLWENWTQEGGKNECAGCPAHWSNREDLDGSPDTRTGSNGIQPFFGYGDLQDVEVVIMGEEPGTLKSDRSRADRTGNSFYDARDPNIKNVAVGSESLDKAYLLFDVVADNFNTYWTQAKKCNELEDTELNTIAENQCVGKNGSCGYLKREIESVDPRYVITLGKDTHKHLSSVFDIEPPWNDWAREIAYGSGPAGIRILEADDVPFSFIPLGHPSHNIHGNTNEVLNLEGNDELTATERYYQLAGEELVKIDNKKN